jgi:uncharacterized protein (TIGR03437 family)
MGRTIIAVLLLSSLPLFSADRSSNRYTVILEDSPLATQFSGKDLKSPAAVEQRKKIEAAQQALRHELDTRKIPVLGAVQTVLNAIFIQATPEQAAEIAKLPGVKGVAKSRRMKRNLDRAAPLVNAPAAWSALGGVGNAGAGIKIGILDTGIDQNNPGLQDPSLSMPAGFPICPQDCSYTNSKVIVARSYVQQFAAGSQPNPAVDSHPDDLSPRDRIGHGTAVAMIAAGQTNSAPAATITGIAPKAYLGNYKIFGSPGINYYTADYVVIQALNDAMQDGMDVVNLSVVEWPASYGPLDQGNACDASAGAACDTVASTVENMMRAGLAVVVSAGNDGDSGFYTPSLNTINSPGTSPSAITVGAVTNSHTFFSSVQVTGDSVPSGLQQINAFWGDGPKPSAPLTAPATDVASLGNDGYACSALKGSLNGAIALIQRGNCDYFTKVVNAANAGAAGVVLYQPSGLNSPDRPVGLSDTSIPAASIGASDAAALKSFLQSNAGRPVTLDPTIQPSNVTPNTVAAFSSQGPAINTVPISTAEVPGIKPDLVAVGTDVYTATESYDPNSDMYDPTGYSAFQGSSFAAPMVAGAVALVKQKYPSLTPSQLKSAVVNTATQDVADSTGNTAGVVAVGAGMLNVANALATNVTVEPATLSFGVVTAASTKSIPLKITNISGNSVSLSLKLVARVTDSQGRLSLSASSLSLRAAQSGTVTVTLGGSIPNPGAYDGALQIQGGSVPLSVPYLYLGYDNTNGNVPANVIPFLGNDFTGIASPAGTTPVLIGFKVVDQFGIPVRGWPVAFSVTSGGGTIGTHDPATDDYGIAAADTLMGPQLGDQEFAGALCLNTSCTSLANAPVAYFDGEAIQMPAIAANGVVNAASGQAGNGLAPGSYLTIYGSAFSPVAKAPSTSYLPIALAGVSVSFDNVPSGKSLPGPIAYVSPGQVNVQIPWEFQGLSSVQIKVSTADGNFSSAVSTVPLSGYSPAVFEYTDAGGERLAAVLDQNDGLVGTGNPAQPGQVIQIYANGLGPVNNQPPSGEPSPASPLATTILTPTVTIGGSPATVQFSGLAPFFVGLYQLNVIVPPGAPSGIQPLVVTAGGVTSKPVNLPVQ